MNFGLGLGQNFQHGRKHPSAILYCIFVQSDVLSIDSYKIKILINSEKR